MYEFLWSEEWWMDTVTQGVLVALLGVLSVVIAEVISNKRIWSKMETMKEQLTGEHNKLTGEHMGLTGGDNKLSGEHNKLSGEHTSLSKEHFDIKEKLTFIERSIVAEKASNETRNSSLNSGQLNMLAVVDSVKSMGEEIKKLSLDIVTKENEILELKEENRLQKERISELESLEKEMKPLTSGDFERTL